MTKTANRWEEYAARSRAHDARRARRVFFWTMPAFGAACVMLVAFIARLSAMRGVTWSAGSPIDLVGVACVVGVPVAFMVIAMMLNRDACDRLASLSK